MFNSLYLLLPSLTLNLMLLPLGSVTKLVTDFWSLRKLVLNNTATPLLREVPLLHKLSLSDFDHSLLYLISAFFRWQCVS